MIDHKFKHLMMGVRLDGSASCTVKDEKTARELCKMMVGYHPSCHEVACGVWEVDAYAEGKWKGR